MTSLETPDGSAPPATRKRFIPLENNPQTMTTLAHTLGLTPTLSFHDVYSLTDPTLLSFLPRPALALLFVFPGSPEYLAFLATQEGPKPEYAGKGLEEPVVWFKQTIGNACGLIGLLHCISNTGMESAVTEGSLVDRLLKEGVPLGMEERAAVLYNSQELEEAHMSAARSGDSDVPDAGVKLDQHYLAFVKGKDGFLYELDGGRKGPTKRGKIEDGDDMLSEKVIGMGIKHYLEREARSGDVRFSVCVLGPSLD